MNRQELLAELTSIQNNPYFANVDIMSFAGMCNNEELTKYIEQKKAQMVK